MPRISSFRQVVSLVCMYARGKRGVPRRVAICLHFIGIPFNDVLDIEVGFATSAETFWRWIG